jgi:DNA-binding transcriptional LysR family regulator
MTQHPAVSIDVNVTSDDPDLIRNRIDVAIQLSDEPHSKLTHFELGPCPVRLCASRDYVARRGVPATPEDLMQHECLGARFSNLAGSWRLGRDGVWQTINPHFKLLSDNGELLRQACLGGAGISLFYDFHIEEDLRAGRLVQVLADFEVPARDAFAIIPHRKIITPQAKAFIDFVRALVTSRLHRRSGVDPPVGTGAKMPRRLPAGDKRVQAR